MATRPMRIRAKESDGVVSVKVLMAHVMETGQRKDAEGKTVPAWHITNVKARCNDKDVLSAQWGPAISRDPYLAFSFKGAKKGDKIEITWIDTKKETRTDTAEIK